MCEWPARRARSQDGRHPIRLLCLHHLEGRGNHAPRHTSELARPRTPEVKHMQACGMIVCTLAGKHSWEEQSYFSIEVPWHRPTPGHSRWWTHRHLVRRMERTTSVERRSVDEPHAGTLKGYAHMMSAPSPRPFQSHCNE